MKSSNPIIASLLSDEKIQALLDKQERTYWESTIGITDGRNVTESMSLPKITFLFRPTLESEPLPRVDSRLVFTR